MVGVRPHVTCSTCGRIHVLERTVVQATTFVMVCHDCEVPVTVEVPWTARLMLQSVISVTGVPVGGNR